MERIKAIATRPIGPFQAWLWVVIFVGAYLVYRFVRGRQSSSGVVEGGNPSATIAPSMDTSGAQIGGSTSGDVTGSAFDPQALLDAESQTQAAIAAAQAQEQADAAAAQQAAATLQQGQQLQSRAAQLGTAIGTLNQYIANIQKIPANQRTAAQKAALAKDIQQRSQYQAEIGSIQQQLTTLMIPAPSVTGGTTGYAPATQGYGYPTSLSSQQMPSTTLAIPAQTPKTTTYQATLQKYIANLSAVPASQRTPKQTQELATYKERLAATK